jgi:hypothetical protein
MRYLYRDQGRLGPLWENRIIQLGETIAAAPTNFQLLDRIPTHRGLGR